MQHQSNSILVIKLTFNTVDNAETDPFESNIVSPYKIILDSLSEILSRVYKNIGVSGVLKNGDVVLIYYPSIIVNFTPDQSKFLTNLITVRFNEIHLFQHAKRYGEFEWDFDNVEITRDFEKNIKFENNATLRYTDVEEKKIQGENITVNNIDIMMNEFDYLLQYVDDRFYSEHITIITSAFIKQRKSYMNTTKDVYNVKYDERILSEWLGLCKRFNYRPITDMSNTTEAVDSSESHGCILHDL